MKCKQHHSGFEIVSPPLPMTITITPREPHSNMRICRSIREWRPSDLLSLVRRKVRSMGHSVRIELTNNGLLAKLANQFFFNLFTSELHLYLFIFFIPRSPSRLFCLNFFSLIPTSGRFAANTFLF